MHDGAHVTFAEAFARDILGQRNDIVFLHLVPSRDSEESLEQPGVMPPDGMIGVQNVTEKLGIFDDRLLAGGQKRAVSLLQYLTPYGFPAGGIGVGLGGGRSGTPSSRAQCEALRFGGAGDGARRPGPPR